MFVERKELVSEIRELRTFINGETKIINGNLKDVVNDITALRSLLELFNERLGQLESKCLN